MACATGGSPAGEQELQQVLSDRAPRAQDLAWLPYTEKVVKEAMRLDALDAPLLGHGLP